MDPLPTISLMDLQFYFDAQAKDRLDVAGPGRRSSEVIALRERLMGLPEHDFDAAIRTIHKLVEHAKPRTQQQQLAEERAQRQHAQQLFERTEPVAAGGGAGVNDISRV